MKAPLVSVLMPVYNAERYVAEAVESVLSQTMRDFEFLIYNDGSTDGSLEILRSYAARDPRICLFDKPHTGYAPWLNEGVRIARGEFVARMDADDIALPSRFADQIEHLRARPDIVIVGSAILLIDPDGAPIMVQALPLDHADIESQLLAGIPGLISHPAAMIRRAALLRIGGYRVEFESVEDYDLLLRLAEIGKLANLPQVLLHYRMHPTSVCFTRREDQLSHSRRILEDARSRRALPPMEFDVRVLHASETGRTDWLWALWAVQGGYRRTGFKHAFRALSRSPLTVRSWLVLGRCCAPNALVRRLRHLLPAWRQIA